MDNKVLTGDKLFEMRDQAGDPLERPADWLGVSTSHLWNCERGRAMLSPEQLSSLQAYYLERISERLTRLGASLPGDNEIPGEQ